VSSAQTPTVLVMRIDDTIMPVVADHIEEGLRTAEREGHEVLLVEMDTPGGLLQSIREIVKEVARSAHVAAMAPGTHVGVGTPVTGQGEEANEKVVNDAVAFAVSVSVAEQRGRSTDFARDMVRDGKAVPDQKALRIEVVDLVAPSRDVLLTELDGRRVTVGAEGAEREVVQHTAGAQVVEHELGFFGELRQMPASPQLACLFLSIGTPAVIYELASPVMGVGSVLGAALLVLGFVAEVLTPRVEVFAAGGAVSLLFAGVLLLRGEPGVDPAVLWPTALVVGGGSVFAGRLACRGRRAPATTGHEALVGREAVVQRAEDGTGQVLLEGAWWSVRGWAAPVAEGQHVRVVDHDGLVPIVEPVEPVEPAEPAQGQGAEQENAP
jgi:membrane-bound serine protease (ClpP class)